MNRCWADCGPHFRSYEFLWNLVEQCDKHFSLVKLSFFAEHHGKGRCDGAFGLQRRWVADYARANNITSLTDMQVALEQGAAATMALDPPPYGPGYHIKVFEPAKKEVTRKLDVAGTGLQIEYTYSILLEKVGPGHVRVYNYILSDRVANKAHGTLVCRAESVEQKCTDEWRRSYRAVAPEKSPLNVQLLQRRRDKQKHCLELANVTRRDPVLTALRRREARQQHAKKKYERQKRILAVNLKEAASESDESSDSSSSAA